MDIDLSALEKAILTLDEAIVRSQLMPADDLLRDGAIQRFEYTFELACKMLKRVLEKMTVVYETIDKLSFNQLLREALEKGLIDDVNQWMMYRHQRNLTSHTYNQEKAEAVYQTILVFIGDVKILLSRLKEHAHD